MTHEKDGTVAKPLWDVETQEHAEQSETFRRAVERLFRYGQVGRCVNALAHDMNNCMGAALAYLELVSFEADLSPNGKRMVAEAVNTIKDGSHLMRTFTGIARKDRPRFTLLDFGKVVQGAVEIRKYDIKVARIELDIEIAQGVPSIFADGPKLTTALVYLLLNAEEALEGRDEPRIHVAMEDSGADLQVYVWNSGPVIPEQERGRIFEPFYTTKQGLHVGLGLTFARTIAEAHKGSLIYDPESGFKLRIPKTS